jgi:hypothetical protein
MGLDVATRRIFQRLGPPLQADFAGHRVGDHVANAHDLDVEGIKGVEMRALVCWREQARKPAVAIMLVYQCPTIFIVARERRDTSRLGPLPSHHGAAINAAATRRFSPSRML